MNPLSSEMRTFFESQRLEHSQAIIQKAEESGSELLAYVLSTIYEILVHTREKAFNVLIPPSNSAIITDYRILVREDIRSMLHGFSGMQYILDDFREGIEFLFPSCSSVGIFFQKRSRDPMSNSTNGIQEFWMQGGNVLLMPITGVTVASTKKAPLQGDTWAYMSVPPNQEARISVQGGSESAALTISRILR